MKRPLQAIVIHRGMIIGSWQVPYGKNLQLQTYEISFAGIAGKSDLYLACYLFAVIE